MGVTCENTTNHKPPCCDRLVELHSTPDKNLTHYTGLRKNTKYSVLCLEQYLFYLFAMWLILQGSESTTQWTKPQPQTAAEQQGTKRLKDGGKNPNPFQTNKQTDLLRMRAKSIKGKHQCWRDRDTLTLFSFQLLLTLFCCSSSPSLVSSSFCFLSLSRCFLLR